MGHIHHQGVTAIMMKELAKQLRLKLFRHYYLYFKSTHLTLPTAKISKKIEFQISTTNQQDT